MNYYNDIDPFVCRWLTALIADGLIPRGVVDDRPIEQVQPADLDGFTQCHFFAGIGGWARALDLAGWPADRPVWTGSCPCQPFSSAGKRLGEADERHVWPSFFRLIAECAPPVVFGEQVASADGRGWLAGVQTDLERVGYAFGAADLCAAGSGAPHIRQRLYWVADAANLDGPEHEREPGRCARRASQAAHPAKCRGDHDDGDGLADAAGERDRASAERRSDCAGTGARRFGEPRGLGGACDGLDDAQGERLQDRRARSIEEHPASIGDDHGQSFWGGSALVECVEPTRNGGTRTILRRVPAQSVFLGMATGLPESVGRLRPSRGYPLARRFRGRAKALKGLGNAIEPHTAAVFIGVWMEARA